MPYKPTIKLFFFSLILAFYSCPVLGEPNPTFNTELQNIGNSKRAISEKDLLDAAIYSNRGSVGTSQKQWNAALQDLNRAIELNPNFARAYMNRGSLYGLLERWDDALIDFDRAIELDPKLLPPYVYRGYIYGFKQEFESALQDLDRAVSLDEQNSTAYYIRATVYQKQKQWDNALQDINRAIEIDPDSAEHYILRGNLYNNQFDEIDKAGADYNQAISLAPDSSKTSLARGIFYTQQEDWDLALKDLNRSLKLDSQNPEAYFSRGNVYALQERWDQATEDYERALELNPNNFQLQSNLRNLQQRQTTGETNIGETNFDKSYAYNSDGVNHAFKQEFTEALEDFNKAIALNQEDAQIYFNRANVYLEQSKWQEALKDYDLVMKLNPQLSHTAYFNRAGIYNMNRGGH